MLIHANTKSVFITLFEIFCYTKMAFGLKNGELHIKNVYTQSWKVRSGGMSKLILMI
jgi:hypothetical protein